MMRHYHQMGSTVGSTPIPDEYKKPIFWKSNETCREDIPGVGYVGLTTSNMWDRLCQSEVFNDIPDSVIDNLLTHITVHEENRIIIRTEPFWNNQKFTMMYTRVGQADNFYEYNRSMDNSSETWTEYEGIIPKVINIYWLDNRNSLYCDGTLINQAVRDMNVYKSIGSDSKYNTNRTPNIYIAQPGGARISDLDRMYINLDCSKNLYAFNYERYAPFERTKLIGYRPYNYATIPFKYDGFINDTKTYQFYWELGTEPDSYRGKANFIPFNYNSVSTGRQITITRPWSPSPYVEPVDKQYTITLRLHCFRILSFNKCEEKRIEIL